MASICAKLKLRDNKFLVIYFRNKQWTTGVQVSNPTSELDKNFYLTKKYKGNGNYEELNKIVLDKLNKINLLIAEGLRVADDPLQFTLDKLEEETRRVNRLAVTRNTTLFDAYKDNVEFKKRTGKQLKEDVSIQRYESELSRIKDYDEYTGKTTKLSHINLEWITDFARYLAAPQKKTFNVYDSKNDRQYTSTKTIRQTNATIKRFIMDIRSLLKRISENSGIIFPFKDITDFINSLRTRNEEDIVIMTNAQWEAFKSYEPNLRLKWEKDVYYLYRFCVNIGMRYSDVIRLEKIYINDNEITMVAEKTRGKFSVEMNDDAQRIFKMFNYSFVGKFPQNQQININLRKLLSKIDFFNKPDVYYEYVLKDVITVRCKSYEKYSFHSSRATFVSRMIRKGAKKSQVCKWTGWLDERTLSSYMDIFSEKDNNDYQLLND